MMKKFVSAIISAVLVAAIIFSFAGCEKFKEVVPSETLATVAEFRMGYVDSIPDDTLLETWASDEYRYKKIISDDFAMGAEGADNFYANPADHIVYGVTVEVVNNTSLPIEVTGIESEMNGSNGVYFRKNFDGGERLVSAKSSEAITLHVLCSNLNISDDEVIETLKSMYFEPWITAMSHSLTFSSASRNVSLTLNSAISRSILYADPSLGAIFNSFL